MVNAAAMSLVMGSASVELVVTWHGAASTKNGRLCGVRFSET